MKRRTRSWLLGILIGLGLLVTIVVVLARYPREVLIGDVRQAHKIIVEWHVPDGNGRSRPVAFELDEKTRAQFEQELSVNLGLDYFRSTATITPTIGIYLVDDQGRFVAMYGIRCDRGGGRCPSMESLRATASKARSLSEFEADEIFNDESLRSKWPHILPSPEVRYDFVLPVTQSPNNPLWDEMRNEPAPGPRLRQTLAGHAKSVLSVGFNPDGKTLATGSWDETIKIWDVASGKNTATLSGHTNEVRSVAFSPDGKTLASAGGRDLTVKLWDATTHVNTATLRGHDEIVRQVAFSPDGKVLASAGWVKTILLWDLASNKNIGELKGCGMAMAFSPDGIHLATGSDGSSVIMWDWARAQKVATLSGHTRVVSSLAFSPDGKQLASGSGDSTVRVWDVATGKNLFTHGVPAPSASGGVSVAYSPDGKILASGGYGRNIRLWDAASGLGLAIFDGYSVDATSLLFSPDGAMLASGSEGDDFAAKLWDVSSGTAKE